MMQLRFMRFAEEDGPDVVDGPYDSVQITWDELRDSEGRTIATYLREQGWDRAADGSVYSDIVVEPAP